MEAMLAEHPDHADAWSNLGLVRKSEGRLTAATEAFRRAIALEPRRKSNLDFFGWRAIVCPGFFGCSKEIS